MVTVETRASAEVTLPVTGMTCASCVRRVEKALKKVPGVHDASVNLATEKASVVYDPSAASLDDLRASVERAGYGLGESVQAEEEPPDLAWQRELDDLKRKWSVSLAAGALMMAVMYLPLQVKPPMEVLAPLLLIVATVVQFWAGRPIYQAAWAAARHGTTNMHTLVAVGTSVAYGYSAFLALWPGVARGLGFRRTRPTSRRQSSSSP